MPPLGILGVLVTAARQWRPFDASLVGDCESFFVRRIDAYVGLDKEVRTYVSRRYQRIFSTEYPLM